MSASVTRTGECYSIGRKRRQVGAPTSEEGFGGENGLRGLVVMSPTREVQGEIDGPRFWTHAPAPTRLQRRPGGSYAWSFSLVSQRRFPAVVMLCQSLAQEVESLDNPGIRSSSVSGTLTGSVVSLPIWSGLRGPMPPPFPLAGDPRGPRAPWRSIQPHWTDSPIRRSEPRGSGDHPPADTTQRKPMLLPLDAPPGLARSAARVLSQRTSHEPPRTTRHCPESGPLGLRSGELV
jgi:hypothetical protein